MQKLFNNFAAGIVVGIDFLFFSATYEPLIVNVENVNDTSFVVVWSHSVQGVTRYIVSAKKTDSRDRPIIKYASADARTQVDEQ